MGNLLYVIAVALIICWLIGWLALNIGNVIHVLFILAIIAVLLRVIKGDSIV